MFALDDIDMSYEGEGHSSDCSVCGLDSDISWSHNHLDNKNTVRLGNLIGEAVAESTPVIDV